MSAMPYGLKMEVCVLLLTVGTRKSSFASLGSHRLRVMLVVEENFGQEYARPTFEGKLD